MSSFDMQFVQRQYQGATEKEILAKFARDGGYWRIYRYANMAGGPYTNYKAISYPGDPQEAAMFSSPYVHNPVLAYQKK